MNDFTRRAFLGKIGGFIRAAAVVALNRLMAETRLAQEGGQKDPL